jgi:hypothetical protein
MPHARDNEFGRAGEHVTPLAGELDGNVGGRSIREKGSQ